MSERSINISLAKIFNFPENNNDVHLGIAFYSKKTESLIIKKTTKSICLNNCLNVGISLKINYTDQ